MQIRYAPDAWKFLNGVFAVYKPEGVPMIHLRNTLIGNIIRDLNLMTVRPPNQKYTIKRSEEDLNCMEVVQDIDWSDHPLVVGPRYQREDLTLGWPHCLSKGTTGVCVVAVNRGCCKLEWLRKSKTLNVYRAKGKLGFATHDFTIDGKIIEKSTFRHVTQAKIDNALSAIQAGHQRHMFLTAGLDIQSQEAYEMAASGMMRPYERSPPIIYGMKCVDFLPPYFIVEIHCINSPCIYLKKLIHEIGLMVKSNAVAAHLQCIRQGYFTLDDVLLRKHWTMENIINAITKCRRLVDPNKLQHQPQLINLPKNDQPSDFLESDANQHLPDNTTSRSFLEFVDKKMLPSGTGT